MITYVIERALKNGLYARVERDVKKHEKVILRAVRENADKQWLRKWLTRRIIGKNRVSLRYECIVDDILRNKYGVP